MNYVLCVALVGGLLGMTGCGCLDTVFYGKQSCAPHWTGSCGSCGDDCGGDCGEAACCGPDGGYCHDCPLIEVLSALHPDNLLCLHEYHERDACGNCGHGCGEKYYGDWYAGERAGCESCDCHGNWAGASRSYSHRGGHVMHGGEHHDGEMIEGEPMPAGPPEPPRRKSNVRPGPKESDMPMPTTQSRSKPRSSKATPSKAVSTKVVKSRKPVTLRPVEADAQWTARR